MSIIYSAVERFDPDCGERWQNFIDWSSLLQLREVISLDGILCPSIFRELTAEDWEHNVQEDYRIHLFRDLEYLLDRAKGNDRVTVLALAENPTANDVSAFTDFRFIFRGYDLVDVHGDVSALVNCGGFPKAFSPTELSEHGLLTDHAKALNVQTLLRVEYPEERHAWCDVWAIWQCRAGPSK